MSMELGPVPAGSGVRRYVREVTRRRTGASLMTIVSDVTAVIVYLAVALGMGVGAAGQLTMIATAGSFRAPFVISSGLLTAAAVAALLGLAASVLRAFGPVNLAPASGAWLLPLPIKREDLAWPSAVGTTLVLAGIGALVGVIGGVLVAPGMIAAMAGGGAILGILIVVILGLGQLPTRRLRPAMSAVVIGIGAFAGMSIAAHLQATLATVMCAAIALVASFAGVVWWVRSLNDIPGSVLRERGRLATQAGTWTMSLDSRELGRLLSGKFHTTKSRSFAWVRGPVSALVAADGRLLARSRRRIVHLAGCVLAPMLVVAGTQDRFATSVTLLTCGYLVGLMASEGARCGETSPALDRIFPTSPRRVRLARTIMPLAIALLWGGVTFAVVFAASGKWWLWAVLGMLWAPTIAGASVRAAYRRPPQWEGPLVATPMGAFPPGVAAVMLAGPDVFIAGSVAVAVAFVIQTPALVLLAYTGGVGILIAITAPRTGLE